MDDFNIRKFEWERDYGRVLEFQEDLYKTNYPGFIASYAFFKEIEKRLHEASLKENTFLLVAERNKRVIAFLWVEYTEEKDLKYRTGVVNQLYIVPKWRNKGVGEAMLTEGGNFLRRNNVRKTQLNVTASNIAAYKLYRKSGFEPVRILMEKENNL